MDINEMIMKGKDANTVEELKEMAIKENWNISDEEANAYFDELQKYKTPNMGELNDDELDNVSGGGCYTKDGRLVVTVAHSCSHWTCSPCYSATRYLIHAEGGRCPKCGKKKACTNCSYCTYEGGKWLCGQPLDIMYIKK